MTAKHKLNAAYYQGALAFATILGALTDSFPVFLIALVALIVGCVMAGDIRR